MSYPRSSGGSVPASRSVALDLILRTFMNSSEFHSSHPKVWDNISKLVPGTTPQQCCARWEELRCIAGPVTGDYSGLTAHGRPLPQRSYTQRRQMAKFVHSMLSSPSVDAPSLLPANVSSLKPPVHSGGAYGHLAGEQRERHVQRQERVDGGKVAHGGKFVANFYSNMMNKDWAERREEREGAERTVREASERSRKVESREKEKTAVRRRESMSKVMKEQSRDQLSEREKEGGEQRNERRKSSFEVQDQKRDHEQQYTESSAISHRGTNMIIHVFDEQRNSKRDFHCPRDVLIREMRYFSDYLSSDAKLWDEVDISVHCDIPVFEWLMKYAKRGLYEGPRGEILDSPLKSPTLEPETVVSILISSDFLKMDHLAEECLDFCHDNISAILASATNMGCISDQLRKRLANKFTPLEVEGISDKRDKIQSKLFIHQIQQLFSTTHSHAECPASAATLHRCKHCGKLITSEQCSILPCTPSRLEVHHDGQLVYSHERDKGWNVSTYLTSLQQQNGLSPREIYWRLWGVINWLRCSQCGQPFQCCDLGSCYYHPQPTMGGRPSTGPPVHICCGSLPADLSPFPLPQSGCSVRDHHVADPSSTPSSPSLFSLLLSHRDIICPTKDKTRKKSSSRDNPLVSSSTTQLSFLKHTDLLASSRKLTNSKSTLSSGPSQVTESVEGGALKLKEGAAAGEQGSENNAVAMEMSPLARQQMASESLELEEDEEKAQERLPPPLHLPGQAAAGHGHRRENKVSHRNSVRRRQTSAPSVAVEWIWDSSKPQRWNQDHERRLSLLCDQLSRSVSTPHSTAPLRETQSYAGGIYSQLEAQFRSQQTARALVQAHGTGSRFSGRKR